MKKSMKPIGAVLGTLTLALGGVTLLAADDADAAACTVNARVPYVYGSNVFGSGGHSTCSASTTSTVKLMRERNNWFDSEEGRSSRAGASVSIVLSKANPVAGNKYYIETSGGAGKAQSGRYTIPKK
jgi:hypothetical protein